MAQAIVDSLVSASAAMSGQVLVYNGVGAVSSCTVCIVSSLAGLGLGHQVFEVVSRFAGICSQSCRV
jgi:hypothetical protein